MAASGADSDFIPEEDIDTREEDEDVLDAADVVDESNRTGLEGIDDDDADISSGKKGTGDGAGDDEAIRDVDPDEIEDVSIVRFKGHEDSVYAAQFHPSLPIIASGDGDDTFMVWDAAKGELLYTDRKSTHKDSVTFTSFSPDGKYLVTSSPSLMQGRKPPLMTQNPARRLTLELQAGPRLMRVENPPSES